MKGPGSSWFMKKLSLINVLKVNLVELVALIACAAVVASVENQTIANSVALLFYGGFYFAIRYLTGRFYLSYFMLILALLAVYASSAVKFQMMGRNLHALDYYLYLNWSMIRYFFDLYPSYAVVALIAPIVAVIAGYVLWISEAARRSRTQLALSAVMIAALPLLNSFVFSSLHNQGRPSTFWLRDRFHLSSTVFSLLDVAQAVSNGRMFQFGSVDADVQKAWPNESSINACPVGEAQEKMPNLVFVLRESAVIPSTLDRRLTDGLGPSRFASEDGTVGTLGVETYGGGTAWTIFSLLSGISTHPFGELRYLVNDLAPSRIDVSLVEALASCGYQTVAVTTGHPMFATSRRYFEEIGFQHVYDIEDLKVHRGGDLSDRAVYSLLHEKMAELAQRSEKPIFAFADTTVAHAPYDYALRPDESVEGLEQLESSTLREYTRRIEIGERDLEGLRRQFDLSKETPTVVVDFGDHHPYFTKEMLRAQIADANDEFFSETFFRIRRHGKKSGEFAQEFKRVDIMPLGDVVMNALDWRVIGYYAFRRQFLEACGGRYWECKAGAFANTLHRMLQKKNALRF